MIGAFELAYQGRELYGATDSDIFEDLQRKQEQENQTQEPPFHFTDELEARIAGAFM